MVKFKLTVSFSREPQYLRLQSDERARVFVVGGRHIICLQTPHWRDRDQIEVVVTMIVERHSDEADHSMALLQVEYRQIISSISDCPENTD